MWFIVVNNIIFKCILSCFHKGFFGAPLHFLITWNRLPPRIKHGMSLFETACETISLVVPYLRRLATWRTWMSCGWMLTTSRVWQWSFRMVWVLTTAVGFFTLLMCSFCGNIVGEVSYFGGWLPYGLMVICERVVGKAYWNGNPRRFCLNSSFLVFLCEINGNPWRFSGR